MSLRVAIVDDEPPARALLTELLGQLEGVELVGEAPGGPEAVELVMAQADAGTRLDALFLDVQMPELDGFGVLAMLAARLETLPAIVFTTAFDRHAVGAFEMGAVDYLLKPVTRSRLEVAMERLRTRVPLTPSEAKTVASSTTSADRLLVRTGDRLVALDVAEIVWVEAAGNYATLHTSGRSHVAGVGIGEVEARLPSERFARVHRSALVALDAVRQLESDGSGGYEALLVGGHRVRISRTYAERFRRLVL
ncbi:MAG: LytTR family DNA-binding domain-containing protein [Bacteroidota bacterium]